MFWKTCFFMHCKWTLWRHTGSSHIYGNIHASILGEQLETILGFRNSECGIFLGGQFSNSRCCMYVRTVLSRAIVNKSYGELFLLVQCTTCTFWWAHSCTPTPLLMRIHNFTNATFQKVSVVLMYHTTSFHFSFYTYIQWNLR